jgi:hypothetical protein
MQSITNRIMRVLIVKIRINFFQKLNLENHYLIEEKNFIMIKLLIG